MSKKTKRKSIKSQPTPKEYRAASGFNQSEFWRLFGVTQSGGSRYENGQPLPKPLKILMRIAVGTISEMRLIVDGLRGASRNCR